MVYVRPRIANGGASFSSPCALGITVVEDYSTRIVANGGTDLTVAQKEACAQFVCSCNTEPLSWSDLVRVQLTIYNPADPSPLLAAAVALKHPDAGGKDVLANFASGDLSIDGLKGNGTTKYVDTLSYASQIFSVYNGGTLDDGATYVVHLTEAPAVNTQPMPWGPYNGASQRYDFSAVSGTSNVAFVVGGRGFFYAMGTPSTGLYTCSAWSSTGMQSIRTPDVDQLVTGLSPMGTLPTNSIYEHGQNTGSLSNPYSGRIAARISARRLKDGSPAEIEALYEAYRTFCTAIGRQVPGSY